MPKIPTQSTPDPRRERFKMPHRFNHRTTEQDTRYFTNKWKKARGAFIKNNPVCKHCGRLASVVDHILPVIHGGEFWDLSNWQPLCKKCHDRKSAREAHWEK
jgi:5-methylcytosine-specific restriction protein A